MVTAPHEAAKNKNIGPEREAVKMADLTSFRPINRIDKAPSFIFFTYRVTREIKQKIGIRQVKSTGGLDSSFRSNDAECTSHVIPT
jgi:hypothetical protein